MTHKEMLQMTIESAMTVAQDAYRRGLWLGTIAGIGIGFIAASIVVLVMR